MPIDIMFFFQDVSSSLTTHTDDPKPRIPSALSYQLSPTMRVVHLHFSKETYVGEVPAGADRGCFIARSGGVYKGQFVGTKFHGLGQLKFSNTWRHDGQWFEGAKGAKILLSILR